MWAQAEKGPVNLHNHVLISNGLRYRGMERLEGLFSGVTRAARGACPSRTRGLPCFRKVHHGRHVNLPGFLAAAAAVAENTDVDLHVRVASRAPLPRLPGTPADLHGTRDGIF